MNFSAIPANRLIGRLLRQPLKLIPDNASLPILQGRLRGKRWIAGAHTHGCWLGSYEIEKQKIFEANLRPGSVVFDIGANAGLYTLLASDIVGYTGFVYAFEPLPRNVGFIKQHLLINKVKNVALFETAVSDSSGDDLFDDSAGSAMGHLSKLGRLRVKTDSIDDLVANKNLRPPTLIKIDVEGGEERVLKGAKSVLRTMRPTILLATHGKDIHARCCSLLQSFDYCVEGLDRADAYHSDELIAYYIKH